MQTVYNITGITCEHCVKAIKSEFGELSQISDVELDVSGKCVITSDQPLELAVLRNALAEAGDYQITEAK